MAIRSPKWLVLAGLVATAPETPGVYELYDGEELVFVGSAADSRQSIRRRLIHHLLEPHPTQVRVTHFSWEISYDPAERRRELLTEFQAAHHRVPRFNRFA